MGRFRNGGVHSDALNLATYYRGLTSAVANGPFNFFLLLYYLLLRY